MAPEDAVSLSRPVLSGNRTRIVPYLLSYPQEPASPPFPARPGIGSAFDSTRQNFTVNFSEEESDSESEARHDVRTVKTNGRGYPKPDSALAELEEESPPESFLIAATPLPVNIEEVPKPDFKKLETYRKHGKSAVFGGAAPVRRKLAVLPHPREDSAEDKMEVTVYTSTRDTPKEKADDELDAMEAMTAAAMSKAKWEDEIAQSNILFAKLVADNKAKEEAKARTKKEDDKFLKEFEMREAKKAEKASRIAEAARRKAEAEAAEPQKVKNEKARAKAEAGMKARGSVKQQPVFNFRELLNSLSHPTPSDEKPESADAMEVSPPSASTENGLQPAPLSSVILAGLQVLPPSPRCMPSIEHESHTRRPLPDEMRQAMQHHGNPYYAPDLELGGAAQRMHTYIAAAQHVTRIWVKMGEEQLEDLIKRREASLLQHMEDLTRDMSFIADFLVAGRLGWKLTDLPHNFFHDVKEISAALEADLLTLTGWKIGGRFRKTREAVQTIRKRLRGIQDGRLAIENGSVSRAIEAAKERDAKTRQTLRSNVIAKGDPYRWS